MKELYCVVLTTGYCFPDVEMYATKEEAQERFDLWLEHFGAKKDSKMVYDYSDENVNSDRVAVIKSESALESKNIAVIHMSRRLF